MAKEKDVLRSNRYKMSYAFLAAVLTVPAVLLIYSLAGRLPGGENQFLYGDLRAQYVAFAKLFWRSLLSGDGIDYTFHISLGMPSVPIYTYYSLSPFNVLYILIDHAELASIVLVVLKLSLAAYTFQRFAAKVLKNDSLSSVVFSVGYALNGYWIVFYYNIMLLDGVYMLPVIAMLIWEAVKEHRFIKLTLAYAYIFVVHFYEGYIIGFFSLLFFVLLMFAEYKKEWKKYLHMSIRFVISVVIAALIGAVFLYPTAVYMLGNQSTINTSSWELPVHIWDVYKNLYIGQFQDIQSIYPYLYCGIMSLYLVPCFVMDHRVEKKHKIIMLVLLGYLLLCSLWLPGYMFMHCFDYPDGCGFRFAYFYPFVLLSIGCAEWKYMDSKRWWKLTLLFLIQTVVYFVVNMGEENITMGDKISNTVFLIAFLVLFLLHGKYSAKKLFQGIFLGIAYIEFIVSGVSVTEKIAIPLMEPRDVYQVFTATNQWAIDEIKAYDSSFYRIAQENIYNPNDSAENQYYGLTYFNTIENIQMSETLRKLGYAVSARSIGDTGGTSLIKMLLAQKYEVIANDADYMLGRSDRLWIKNNRFLSLGYMVSDEILDIAFDEDNVFENQNSLALGMTGEDISVFTPYPGEITGITENMVIYWDEELNGIGMEPEEGETEGSLTFCMDDMGMPAYAYFAQDISVWSTKSVYFESGENSRMRIWMPAVLSLPQIIELAKDEEGRYYVAIHYDQVHSYCNLYKEAYFYCYDDAALDKVYELLADNQMNISEMKGSDITAEIDVPSDKHILFTSIPYDEGWHILVDGREAETLSVVNDTFLAVELTEGHHELKFYYGSAVNRTGAILSICGIVFVIGLLFAEKRNAKKPTVKDHSTISTKEKQTTPEQRSEIY